MAKVHKTDARVVCVQATTVWIRYCILSDRVVIEKQRNNETMSDIFTDLLKRKMLYFLESTVVL